MTEDASKDDIKSISPFPVSAANESERESEPLSDDGKGARRLGEFRAIRPEEREACLDLWRTVWPGAESRAYFARYFYGDIEWLPYYTQVAVVGGKIVSAAHICKRMVACGEFRLTMGGIANVATLPEFRGMGFNTECLCRAITVMEADAMDFSLLFTGIHDYYARLGYATIPRRGLTGTLRPDFSPRPTAYTVRPAVADDLPAIREIYDTYNRGRPIAVQRSEAYWRDWLRIAPDRIPDTLLVAADITDTVRGYIQTGTFRSAVPYSADEAEARVVAFGITEGVSEEEKEEITIALLDAVASRLPASERHLLRLDIPLEPSLFAALAPVLQSQEFHVSRSGMVRLLHRDNLMKSLTLPWNERWMEAGRPRGSVAFQTPYGPTRLDANGSFLRVMRDEDTTDTLGQEVFFGLLFSTLKPEQVTQERELLLLLNALFPPQAFVFWPGDGF